MRYLAWKTQTGRMGSAFPQDIWAPCPSPIVAPHINNYQFYCFLSLKTSTIDLSQVQITFLHIMKPMVPGVGITAATVDSRLPVSQACAWRPTTSFLRWPCKVGSFHSWANRHRMGPRSVSEERADLSFSCSFCPTPEPVSSLSTTLCLEMMTYDQLILHLFLVQSDVYAVLYGQWRLAFSIYHQLSYAVYLSSSSIHNEQLLSLNSWTWVLSLSIKMIHPSELFEREWEPWVLYTACFPLKI